jgi:hypothetical protein
MKVRDYFQEDDAQWDTLVARAPMATFLHTRRFLSYHGSRFQDVSSVITSDEGRLLAAFPAAVDPGEAKRVLSHPGITYGGLVHGRDLRGASVLDALQKVQRHYENKGFESLRYKAVPYVYHQVPSSDDLYALFRLGARRYRCDLSCTIDLAGARDVSPRRRRALKKSSKSNITIDHGPRFAEELWRLLEENLASKYATVPAHSLGEIRKLNCLFPQNIEFVVALLDSEVLAGVVLFSTARVAHVQYAASSVTGHATCALDAALDHCIGEAQTRGMRYFDFGISNEREGHHLNGSLYEFKAEFGGGGVVHEFYELPLRM